jgi:hypothetical protein
MHINELTYQNFTADHLFIFLLYNTVIQGLIWGWEN